MPERPLMPGNARRHGLLARGPQAGGLAIALAALWLLLPCLVPGAIAAPAAATGSEAVRSLPAETDAFVPRNAPDALPHCTVPAPAPAACSLGQRLAQICAPPPVCRQNERPCYIRRDSRGCITWRCCQR